VAYWHTHFEPVPRSPRLFHGPRAFLNPDPAQWAQTALNFRPDAVQSRILGATANHLILCCTRQFGKSTITAIRALHHAWHYPRALVLVAAPTARQSGEWIEKSSAFLRILGVRPRGDGRNPNSLVLPNGSRLVGLPGVANNIRGFSSVSLLLIDEAAFVPDDLYHALNPMLAVSRGALWLMSTPNGQSGFFYDQWHREPSGWERFQVTAADCSRISSEFLAEQRIRLGDPIFRREYLCEFTAGSTQIIDRDMLDAAFDPAIHPLNGGQPLWRD
jgi:hypothetical protein